MRFIYLGGSGTRAELVNGARLARRSAGRWTTSVFNLETIRRSPGTRSSPRSSNWVYQSEERDRHLDTRLLTVVARAACTAARPTGPADARPSRHRLHRCLDRRLKVGSSVNPRGTKDRKSISSLAYSCAPRVLTGRYDSAIHLLSLPRHERVAQASSVRRDVHIE